MKKFNRGTVIFLLVTVALLVSLSVNVLQAGKADYFKAAFWGAHNKISCSFNSFIATCPESVFASEENSRKLRILSRNIVGLAETISGAERD